MSVTAWSGAGASCAEMTPSSGAAAVGVARVAGGARCGGERPGAGPLARVGLRVEGRERRLHLAARGVPVLHDLKVVHRALGEGDARVRVCDGAPLLVDDE